MRALQPLVVIGAGGHGREALEIVRAINAATPTFTVLGVLDDDASAESTLARIGIALLGPPELLADIDAMYVIGVGDSAARKRIADRVHDCDNQPATLVHPHASVGDDVELGPGTIINAGSRVTTYTSFGRHVHLNTNANIAHDSRLEDFVTISPGVSLAGTVHLHEGVTLFTNATVIPGRTIGAWTTVGAGAVVTRDLPPGVTAVGVPALARDSRRVASPAPASPTRRSAAPRILNAVPQDPPAV